MVAPSRALLCFLLLALFLLGHALKDPYKVLGVGRQSSAGEIKKAYKTLGARVSLGFCLLPRECVCVGFSHPANVA